MKEVKLAVIYYSSTGTNYQLAQWAAQGAKEAGVGEVKVLKIKELAPESAIAANPDWQAHVEATQDVPMVSLDVWSGLTPLSSALPPATEAFLPR
ncbi:hypothetical protein BH24BAC1_BH24BAC1_14550 [soil metagenome]